jgi:transposase
LAPPPETADELQPALETSEIAAAAMTARLRLPDVQERGRPKRRPIPDHVPRMEVELSPAADACADCGGKLRRIGENVTEELDYVPGGFIVNRFVRPPLACTGCERFVQAPLPSRPIERGRRWSWAARPCAGQQIRRAFASGAATP